MGMNFKLGTRKDDPVLELNAKTLYESAVNYGCENRTAALLVQALLQAEEQAIIESGEQDESKPS